MVTISINYAGELRCNATHDPSGSMLSTDAPLDNNGKGETFSPTDLVATALGNCMATIMGIVAQRKSIPLEGLRIYVEKHMSEDMPRRISKLAVAIHMPMAENDKHKELMINAALSCPVHQSLHPNIEIPIQWVWQTS
jgi:putative redox protein